MAKIINGCSKCGRKFKVSSEGQLVYGIKVRLCRDCANDWVDVAYNFALGRKITLGRVLKRDASDRTPTLRAPSPEMKGLFQKWLGGNIHDEVGRTGTD